MSLAHRYDFVLLFDVKDGNPNGDPDAGNLPRLDAESGHGLVTDVCIKRKVRNFVSISKRLSSPHNIYVQERAVLGRAHFDAFRDLGIKLGEAVSEPIDPGLATQFADLDLPEGVTVEGDAEDNDLRLVLAPDIDKKAVKDWIAEARPSAAFKKVVGDALKRSTGRKPTPEESDGGRKWLCEHYFDIRTFGAVLSLKSAPNCGQVRGPVQLTFARSIDPVVSSEHAITRMAVATEAEAEKQQGDNRTMGRKFTIPYGLYRAHGFVSAHLANQTGFTDEDLALLWQALAQMFEHDRSAARGLMSTRGLYVFEHDSALGNAPAHQLFERIEVKLKDASVAPRNFSDYVVTIADGDLPAGVKLHRQVG